MSVLQGYTLVTDWEPTSNGQYALATKDGGNYFIKTFMRPKYPLDRSSNIFEQRKKECDDWLKTQNTLLKELKHIAGPAGNVVVPLDLFREGASFYKVTLKIDMSTMTPKNISTLPEEDILLMLKTLVGSIGALHRVKIVHGDLKPENILVSCY
jgi:serine/threonine protein kinase